MLHVLAHLGLKEVGDAGRNARVDRLQHRLKPVKPN